MAETSYARRLRARGNDYRRDTPNDRRFQRPYGYWDALAAAHSCYLFTVPMHAVGARDVKARIW